MSCHPISRTSQALWPLALVLLAAATVTAQPRPCSLRIEQLPAAMELLGFRLGMTHDQVKTLVPQVRFARPDHFGVDKTSINPHFDPRIDQVTFADVRTISLDFLDGKLVTLWIGYETTFKWQRLDDFIGGFNKSLNLPEAWTPKRTGREISCDGFTVFASIIAGSPGLRISDAQAQETIASRREAATAITDAAEAGIVGDQRTKLYYPTACPAGQQVATPDRIKFKDKDEAEKAGYKVAGDCK